MTTKDHVTAAGCATGWAMGPGVGLTMAEIFSLLQQLVQKCVGLALIGRICFVVNLNRLVSIWIFLSRSLRKKKKIGVKCLMGVAKI